MKNKFWRGEKVKIDSEEITNLKAKMENREKRTVNRKNEIERKLSANKKLVDLKSKRHLELYNKRSREWRQQELKVLKLMKRSKTQNLYSAIDNYREKREERELWDKIAPVVDKFGESKFWRMNLRRKELEEPRLFKLDKGDLVENKWYIAVDDPRKVIPVVRRPKSSYTNYRNREWDSVKKSFK